ncbi:MAG: type II secretion system protein [Sedimentisphaerales bacterium]|nr:type II secretion system protein [Sedimentisphaerales bacterium]
MRSRAGTDLIELLVVMSVVSMLLAILLPVATRARLQAKVLTVNAELRDIGLALEAYSMDNAGLYPPTRVDCMLGGHYYQLPLELTEAKYLPCPDPDSFMSAGIHDRFNKGYTYKYRSVGTMIYNRTTVIEGGAKLWVPDGFPDSDTDSGAWYSDLAKSPVSWVVYSVGPYFTAEQEQRLKALKYPVPKSTWYDPAAKAGVIVRMRLRNGMQIGSF